jgi:hypothetical protein
MVVDNNDFVVAGCGSPALLAFAVAPELDAHSGVHDEHTGSSQEEGRSS